jgi:RNA polymerase sigma-70 factor (ECF subfamily)
VSGAVGGSVEKRTDFGQLLVELRPKLHRYCARMTGSVIDGEDVVQDTIVKALEVLRKEGSVANLEGWLLRIAHNTALDFLRRRARHDAICSDKDPDMMADRTSGQKNRQIAAVSFRTFMRLPATQRSSVILIDVLGYSLDEVAGIIGATVPTVKAALHRGRRRIRKVANEPDDQPSPALAESERSLLAAYVDRFNARDFDAIRNMLADEVRVELVSRTRMKGKREASTYFQNYDSVDDWRFVTGFMERWPAILVHDPRELSAKPIYFVVLEWTGDRVTRIRDFRHARYVFEDAAVRVSGDQV